MSFILEKKKRMMGKRSRNCERLKEENKMTTKKEAVIITTVTIIGLLASLIFIPAEARDIRAGIVILAGLMGFSDILALLLLKDPPHWPPHG